MLVLCSPASAQVYRTIEYGEKSGLPTVRVHDVEQLASGEMVFCTRAGIVYFDGRDWSLDEEFAQLGLRPGMLLVDPAGRLWACGNNVLGGVAVRTAGEWRQLPGLEESIVESDPDNARPQNVRITGIGLLSGSGQPVFVVATFNDGLHLWAEDSWQHVSPPASLEGLRICSLQARGGTLYLGTNLGLVTHTLAGTWSLELSARLAVRSGSVLAVLCEEEATWLLSEEWLGRIAGDKFEVVTDFADKPLPGPDDKGPGRLSSHLPLALDGVGGLWIGADDRVWHYDWVHKELNQNPIDESNSSRGATGFVRDREGALWRSSLRGITRTPSLRFANMKRGRGFFDDEVTAIAQIPGKPIILGHGRALTYLEEKAPRLHELEDGSDTQGARIIEICPDENGQLWIAQGPGGVISLDPDGEVIARPFESHEQMMVLGINIDSQGVVRAATSGGLFAWDGELFRRVDTPVARNKHIRRVLELEHGVLCICIPHGGIYIREEGEWQHYAHPDNILINDAFCAYRDRLDRVLVGSTAGLFVAVDGQLQPPAEEELRLKETVYFILEDNEGALWIGTLRGVVRWDGRVARHYSVEQGLAGRETNRGASWIDKRGDVWIGTVGGASRYCHEFDRFVGPAPLLELLSCEAAGSLLDLNRSHKLPHSSNDLRFRFHSVDFADEGAVSYSCRLEGYDTDWLSGEETADGRMRYTSLEPGEYRFHVQARSTSGVLSETITSETIIISKPIWSRWWFRWLVLACGLVIVWILASYFIERRRSSVLGRLVQVRSSELEASEGRYRHTFELSRAAQLLLDAQDGCILAANQAAVDFYGYPLDEIIGKAVVSLDVEESGSAATLGAQSCSSADLLEIPAGEGRRLELSQQLAGGEVRRLEIFASQYHLDGRSIVHTIVHDVTDRALLQEQLIASQRLESVGLLAGGIAHDFNNLLTVILGNLEWVDGRIPRSDEQSEQISDVLGEVRGAAQRAAALTRQLLTFSRRQVMHAERVNMNQVLASMEGMIRRLVREDVTVEIRGDSALCETIIDPAQLEQVIMNLVANAGDAMRADGSLVLWTANVSMRTHGAVHGVSVAEADHVMLAVRDTGMGMDAQTRSHIFEPFFTTKPVGEGTGLGLAMIHGIAEQAGGKVEVSSEVGVGTEIRIFLPAVKGQLQDAETIEVYGEETLLLCEGDEALRSTASQALEANGYTVYPAAHARAALELLDRIDRPIDMLVTDVTMPGMDGRQLARKVVALQPGVKVLYVLGQASQVVTPRGETGSEMELINKPFSSERLLRRVRHLFDA